MVRRFLIVFLSVLVSYVFSNLKSTAVTPENISSCEQYNIFFEAAFQLYNTPINVLRAVALHESQCLQSARNPSDGGCGIMQLTGNTRTRVALLLGVSEATLCEDTQEGARLNILGGAVALDDFKCFANPRVFSGDDFNACVQGDIPFTDDEIKILSETIEAWWWPVVRYNGGGEDTFLTTSNYPFRVWHYLDDEAFQEAFFLISNVDISYPPHIEYLQNRDPLPGGNVVRYSPNELSSRDDTFFPTPGDLGKPEETGGIRWTNGNFNPFVDVVLHRNDGSVYASTLTCHTLASNSQAPSPYGLAWHWLSSQRDLLLTATCHPDKVTAIIGSTNAGSSEANNYRNFVYTYEGGYAYVNNQWQQVSFTCNGTLQTSSSGYRWCSSTATADLPVNTAWFVGYTCIWDGSKYQCGCTDTSCTSSFWQLQGVQR